jgi:hypothetical protein
VDSEKEFQEKMRRLGTLVGEIDQVPGGGSKVAARELVQLLMEVHRSCLERIMELVFQTGSESRTSGGAIIDRLGQDPIVRNLLLLYSLHPDDLETRVVRALKGIRPHLRKFDSRVELASIHEGAVQLRLHTSGHPHGSTIKDLRAIVEGAIYDLAPDLMSLTILAPEEKSSSGFVPLQSLLNMVVHSAGVDSAD